MRFFLIKIIYAMGMDSHEKKNMAKKMKSLRKRAGYTQATFAKAVGVTQATVSRWESGKDTPDFKKMDILTELLDCSIACLLSDAADTPGDLAKPEDGMTENLEWLLQEISQESGLGIIERTRLILRLHHHYYPDSDVSEDYLRGRLEGMLKE